MDFLYNGDIINAFTGMFTLKYSLQHNKDFGWDYLKNILSNDN